MADTKIEWADKVWNPVTGCTKVSQGCKHCYAETIADRFWATQYPPNADGTPRKFTDVRCHEDRLQQPFHWNKPARIFVNSMSDLFHPDVPDNFIGGVFEVMQIATNHVFMILTKRPARMLDMGLPELPNVWLGVSTEDQKTADERIPLLLQTPAAVRFISYEPALRYVNLSLWDSIYYNGEQTYKGDLLHLVIMGCESGPGARPMEEEWARGMREQCQAAGVSFFFKQAMRDGKLTKLPLLDGRQWKEFPNEPRL